MIKQELLETWFRRVWAEEDLDAIDAMMVPETNVYGLRKIPQLGPREFRGFAELMLQRLSNVEVGIERMIEDGDWASILMHITAKNRETGADITFDGLAMVKIEDDAITAAYNYVDFIGLFEQLGLMPGETLATCLCGKSVA